MKHQKGFWIWTVVLNKQAAFKVTSKHKIISYDLYQT